MESGDPRSDVLFGEMGYYFVDNRGSTLWFLSFMIQCQQDDEQFLVSSMKWCIFQIKVVYGPVYFLTQIPPQGP